MQVTSNLVKNCGCSRIHVWRSPMILNSTNVNWRLTVIQIPTIILIQHAASVEHSEVNVFHSVAIIIPDRCSTGDVLRDAKLARDPRMAWGVVKWYHNIKHTVRSDSHTRAVNMVESSLLFGRKWSIFTLLDVEFLFHIILFLFMCFILFWSSHWRRYKWGNILSGVHNAARWSLFQVFRKAFM